MGGGKGGGGEAAAARADEQARQARIRQGTADINRIFDGGLSGIGAFGSGSTYDPNTTYYKSDGSLWNPKPVPEGLNDFQSRVDNGQPIGLVESMMYGMAQHPGSAQDQFQSALSSGGLFSGTEQKGGFNEDFFNQRRQAFVDYATPQLSDQYADAQKQLTFALARGGNLDSSVRGQQTADLQKQYDLANQQIADQAISYEKDARNSVEDARSNLIATLNATGDVQGAVNSALARSTALSQPQAFSPLANLFADFTAGLGTQAAMERANAYSGGLVKSRYNTGLFAPNPNSVKVT